MKREGCLVGVGLGPGDPELITVKAQRVLQKADCIVHPASNGTGRSFSLDILRTLEIPKEKLVEISLCMGKDRTQALSAYEAAAKDIAGRVRSGQTVAFITEGDPFFYSTFIYLYETMRTSHPDVSVEIVPGISSVFQAAGKAGWPAARQDERVAIISSLASEKELDRLLRDFDTVFLLKLTRTFSIAFDYLCRRGLLENAVYLEKLGTAEERIERDLRKVDAGTLPYFSMLMMRKERRGQTPSTSGRKVQKS